MNRRNFIETSFATLSLAAANRAWGAHPANHISHVGLQLYTVREMMKQDFAGTLAKVAGVGYKEVEFAGYFGKTPKEAREILDRNGLTSPSEHVAYDVVEKQWAQTLDDAHVTGQKYIICPWIEESQRKEADGWKRAAELFNKAGEASQKADIQFGYHNHAFEFQPSPALDGKMPYDFLLAETDPKLVKMEMDLCWITVGGQDPVKYFDRYPGRFPLVHVKDWKKDNTESNKFSAEAGRPEVQGHMADVGQGSIDWKRILGQSGKAGIKYYIVENDQPKSPIEDIRISYEYLAKLEV